MRCAVVPVDANRLRPAAQPGQPEEEPMARPVEMASRKSELPQFAPDGSFVEFEIVGAKRFTIAVEESNERFRGKLAVLKRDRNPLAHQRIDAGRVASQYHAAVGEFCAALEPSNREGLEAEVVGSEAGKRQI